MRHDDTPSPAPSSASQASQGSAANGEALPVKRFIMPTGIYVYATDFDAIASRLEEAERLRDQAYSHEDGYLQTIGKLEDNCCKAMDERDAAIKDADDMRAELRKHCGCEFEDIEIADRPRTATCLLHLEAERDAARYRWLRDLREDKDLFVGSLIGRMHISDVDLIGHEKADAAIDNFLKARP